ncbi:MAG: hypothetical protein IBJ16_07075 [Chitinophagaceae bacterium]|nr:hypothetical protein [Chitinophagaceae bacterium]
MLALKSLAQEGYNAYREICDGLDEKFRYYLDEFLHTRKTTTRLMKEAEDLPNLRVIFSEGISFPVGLLYSKDPRSLNWNLEHFLENIAHFFDLKFRIYNCFKLEAFKVKGYMQGDVYLKDKKSIKVIHALDERFEIEKEKELWQLDTEIDPRKVVTVEELVDHWKMEPHPRIIHFSSHFTLAPEQSPPYSLSLSNGHLFTRNTLWDIKPKPERKALFFLNVCKSANLEGNFISNIFSDLFPDYALGFIATVYNLPDKEAAEMPERFYETFFNTSYPILRAYADAKRSLILSKRKLSALGYTFWLTNINLRYSEKEATKPNKYTNGFISSSKKKKNDKNKKRKKR